MAKALVGSPGQNRIRIVSSTTQHGERRMVVTSATDARRRYIVTRRTSGRWLCSCKRWIFGVKQPDGSRRRENCKHIRAIK